MVRRSCVFCGAPADSREHAFAKRLCKRAGAVRFPVIQGLYTQGKGTVTRKEHHVESGQVRHMGANCNNTWMNDLETWFETRLGCLIEPQWPKLALTKIETVRAEGAQLAHWLMKTAVMFSLASLQGNLRVQFEPEVTGKIKEGILPDHCWVDLAYSNLSTLGGAIGKCFRVINGGKYNPSQVLSRGVGFRFTVRFNHLLLRIARAHGANVTYQSWNGELPVRLYPTPATKIPVEPRRSRHLPTTFPGNWGINAKCRTQTSGTAGVAFGTLGGTGGFRSLLSLRAQALT